MTTLSGARGIDGQTAMDYAADPENTRRSLLERATSGRYKAPAARRVHILKGTRCQSKRMLHRVTPVVHLT